MINLQLGVIAPASGEYILVEATMGANIQDCTREAIALAVLKQRPVLLKHNGKCRLVRVEERVGFWDIDIKEMQNAPF